MFVCNDTVLIYIGEHGDLPGQTLYLHIETPHLHTARNLYYSTNHRLNELMQSDMNVGGERLKFVNNIGCLKKAWNCLAICNSNICEIVGSIEIGR